MGFQDRLDQEITRRTLLKAAGAGALSLSSAALLDACGILGTNTSSNGKITIGYVSPQTGEAAGFATGDNYVINGVRAASAYKNGFKVGGKTYDVQIVVKDTQSDQTRAGTVTQELINAGVDNVLCASTPEVTNPVANLCEANGVPCVATIVPWESWFFGRGATATKPFKYTTMFFFGLHEFAGCFFPMWQKMNTNKVVAEMYPNDSDGGALRSNFNAFWKQAVQQGFKPKLATVAKVLLFPADTTALGDLVINIATDCWWSPFHPYSSTLTGQTAKQLADGFEQSSGQQWLSSLGSVHSLFEIAYEALTNVNDPHDKTAVAAKLNSLTYSGISGPLDWTKGPVPGVAIQQPVGVQWTKGPTYPYSMVVVDTSLNPDVPLN